MREQIKIIFTKMAKIIFIWCGEGNCKEQGSCDGIASVCLPTCFLQRASRVQTVPFIRYIRIWDTSQMSWCGEGNCKEQSSCDGIASVCLPACFLQRASRVQTVHFIRLFRIWDTSQMSWCGWRDLNPHAFRHKILSLACLPFHHIRKKYNKSIIH